MSKGSSSMNFLTWIWSLILFLYITGLHRITTVNKYIGAYSFLWEERPNSNTQMKLERGSGKGETEKRIIFNESKALSNVWGSSYAPRL